jgi:hypothetical protein
VGGEDEVSAVAYVGRKRGERRDRILGERLDETGVVEKAPDLVDLGSTGAHLGAGSLDVVQVLPAARVGAVRGGDEGDGPVHAVIGHRPQRVGQVR